MDFHYFFFGLHLRSNLPLSGVSTTNSSTDHFDVELHLGIPQEIKGEILPGSEVLTYASTETNAAGEPVLRIMTLGRGEFLRFTYEDGTEFWLDRKRENVWATWPDTESLENATAYLLGPVLGLLLRQRGVTCLHASAVAIEDRSVAFVGAAGAGKSTTAAAFARQGIRILSDDIVALTESAGSFEVLPGCPYLRLWPDSAKICHDSPGTLPRIIPGGEKRRLALGNEGARFESRLLRLGAIYLLGDRRPDPAPYVEEIRGQAALLSLVADTYGNKTLDRDLRAQEFRVLGQLVEKVPILRVFPHEDLSRIGDLCRVIRENFVSLQTSARPDR